jgi:hypothetical protein
MSKIDPEELRPLAFPEYHSLGQQNDARTALRAALAHGEQDVEAAYRDRHREPAQNVTEVEAA